MKELSSKIDEQSQIIDEKVDSFLNVVKANSTQVEKLKCTNDKEFNKPKCWEFQ